MPGRCGPDAQRACVKAVWLFVAMPSATGTSSRPSSRSSRLTKRARNAVSPQAVLMPRKSNSGLASSSASAKLSSMSSPMSRSTTTGMRGAA